MKLRGLRGRRGLRRIGACCVYEYVFLYYYIIQIHDICCCCGYVDGYFRIGLRAGARSWRPPELAQLDPEARRRVRALLQVLLALLALLALSAISITVLS